MAKAKAKAISFMKCLGFWRVNGFLTADDGQFNSLVKKYLYVFTVNYEISSFI
jgi:hypothetical protein